jgi:hypothetical protein
VQEGQQEINLKYLVPTVATDGHVIFISDNDVPSIMFFQAREQHEGHVHSDVVASVRLGTIADLEGLGKAITDTIKNHKNREK